MRKILEIDWGLQENKGVLKLNIAWDRQTILLYLNHSALKIC